MCAKNYICNPSTCTCENSKYLGIIIGDSVITCNEVIEVKKTISTDFKQKKVTCNIENIYVLVTFLLITILVLIGVSINCCLIKHRSKQENLLPYYDTSNKF